MKGRATSTNPALGAWIAAVDVAAVVCLVVFAPGDLLAQWTTLALLATLAALAGAHPVRLESLKTQLTATQPFVLCALAALGPKPAVVVAMAGVFGAMWDRKPRPIQLAFNLGALTVSTVAAYAVFAAAGGVPGAAIPTVMGPLVAATTVYFVTNTGLVSVTIALVNKISPVTAWRSSFRWTTVTWFAGLSMAVCMLLVLEGLGPWGLALGFPPCALLVGFYRFYRDRLDEKQSRIDEVESLNAQLESVVADLNDALAHVKQLQGLLPVCMHCKSVRDDGDTWHRLEAYLALHSDAQVTHSLCEPCRAEHYPTVPRR